MTTHVDNSDVERGGAAGAAPLDIPGSVDPGPAEPARELARIAVPMVDSGLTVLRAGHGHP